MKKILSLLLIILFLFSVSACNSKKQKFTDYSFDYFDTVTTIIGFEKDKKTFDDNCEKIKGWLLEYHKLFDIYSSYDGINNLHTLNHSQGKEIKVSKKIIALINNSKSIYNNTNNGKFNIAMGSVLSIWHDYRSSGIKHPEKAELPPEKLLKEAVEHTDINDIIVNTDKGTVLIKDKKLTIDVGGIAKGYTVDEVSALMSENGISGYILNIGGNVKTVGEKHDGKPWTVGIENPDRQSSQDYVEKIELDKDLSVVTSGSYQRFYTVDGKNYNHIIDPSTLYPSEYFASVSVVTDVSMYADALSTALFCLSYEEGIKLLENFNNTEAMWVTHNGQKLYTENFKKYIINN